MKLTEIYPELAQRSVLPPGGSPRWDREYEGWLRDYLADKGPEILDRLTMADGEILRGFDRIVNHYSLNNHFFRHFLGWDFPSGTGPAWLHKLRFLAIQHHHRRSEFVVEADAYVDRKISEFIAKHRETDRP
jgi:hypothetical protein